MSNDYIKQIEDANFNLMSRLEVAEKRCEWLEYVHNLATSTSWSIGCSYKLKINNFVTGFINTYSEFPKSKDKVINEVSEYIVDNIIYPNCSNYGMMHKEQMRCIHEKWEDSFFLFVNECSKILGDKKYKSIKKISLTGMNRMSLYREFTNISQDSYEKIFSQLATVTISTTKIKDIPSCKIKFYKKDSDGYITNNNFMSFKKTVGELHNFFVKLDGLENLDRWI